MKNTVFRGVVSVWSCSLAVWLLGGHPVLAQEKAAPQITRDRRSPGGADVHHLSPGGQSGVQPGPGAVLRPGRGQPFRPVPRPCGRDAGHASSGETRGVSFDAVMGMAVHVTDAVSLQEKIPLSPQPKSLDSRWTPETAREFLALARKFVGGDRVQGLSGQARASVPGRDSDACRRCWTSTPTWSGSTASSAPARARISTWSWACSTGAAATARGLVGPDGQEELYSVVGVWMVDSQGQPTFPPGVVPTIVHEFTHSYTNALVDQFAQELPGPGRDDLPLRRRRNAQAGVRGLEDPDV